MLYIRMILYDTYKITEGYGILTREKISKKRIHTLEGALLSNSQEPEKDVVSEIVGYVLFFILLGAAILVVPGMVVLGLANRVLTLHLDIAQLWTFSILFTIVGYGIIAIRKKSAMVGFKRYLLFASITLAFVLVSFFGFKAVWPVLLLRGFFPT